MQCTWLTDYMQREGKKSYAPRKGDIKEGSSSSSESASDSDDSE